MSNFRKALIAGTQLFMSGMSLNPTTGELSNHIPTSAWIVTKAMLHVSSDAVREAHAEEQRRVLALRPRGRRFEARNLALVEFVEEQFARYGDQSWPVLKERWNTKHGGRYTVTRKGERGIRRMLTTWR